MKQPITGININLYVDDGILSVSFNRGDRWRSYAKYWKKEWTHDVEKHLQRATTLQGLLLKRSLNEQTKD